MGTITKALIGEEDINFWNGDPTQTTFTRLASLGGTQTMTKVGYEVDVLRSHAGNISAALSTIGTVNKATILLRPGTYTISGDTDWSAYTNVTFKFEKGAILSGNYAITFPTGTTIPSSAFNSLAEAVVLIGTSTITIEIDRSETLSDDVTLSLTTTVKMQNGHIISPNGHTFTILGNFTAGNYKVFNGAGVRFGQYAVAEVLPNWWGMVAENADASIMTANSASLQYAVDSFITTSRNSQSTVPIIIDAGYNINTSIVIGATPAHSPGTANVFKGRSNSAIIHWLGGAYPVFDFENEDSTGEGVEDLRIMGGGTATHLIYFAGLINEQTILKGLSLQDAEVGISFLTSEKSSINIISGYGLGKYIESRGSFYTTDAYRAINLIDSHFDAPVTVGDVTGCIIDPGTIGVVNIINTKVEEEGTTFYSAIKGLGINNYGTYSFINSEFVGAGATYGLTALVEMSGTSTIPGIYPTTGKPTIIGSNVIVDRNNEGTPVYIYKSANTLDTQIPYEYGYGYDIANNLYFQNGRRANFFVNADVRYYGSALNLRGTPMTVSSPTANVEGGFRRNIVEATATLSGSSTTITLSIPTGAKLLGVQLRVDTLITSAAATTWSAAYSGGSTTSICSGQVFTANTKVNYMQAGYELTTNTTNIVITPNTGTFTGGVIRAVAYYEDYNTLSDNAAWVPQ